MMRNKSSIISAFVVGLIIIIGFLMYFVSSISATYPAIKKYEFVGSSEQLMSNLNSYADSYSSVSLKIADKVGSEENYYATFITIEMQINERSIEYSIKCEENSVKKLKTTTISLVEAYDKTNNTGGYDKEAKGVKSLVNEFDDFFLKPLSNTQKISLRSL